MLVAYLRELLYRTGWGERLLDVPRKSWKAVWLGTHRPLLGRGFRHQALYQLLRL